MLSHIDLHGLMTLVASGTGDIEFFVTAQMEGKSQCEQTIDKNFPYIMHTHTYT